MKKSVVGLVVPTGYSFNLDGAAIYLSLAAVYIAQATNSNLTITQQIGLMAIMLLTSKGAAGVAGGGFIALAATLSTVGTIPAAGIMLIFGIDKFMSECRALVNFIGNAVATLFVAKWDKDPGRRPGPPGPERRSTCRRSLPARTRYPSRTSCGAHRRLPPDRIRPPHAPGQQPASRTEARRCPIHRPSDNRRTRLRGNHLTWLTHHRPENRADPHRTGQVQRQPHRRRGRPDRSWPAGLRAGAGSHLAGPERSTASCCRSPTAGTAAWTPPSPPASPAPPHRRRGHRPARPGRHRVRRHHRRRRGRQHLRPGRPARRASWHRLAASSRGVGEAILFALRSQPGQDRPGPGRKSPAPTAARECSPPSGSASSTTAAGMLHGSGKYAGARSTPIRRPGSPNWTGVELVIASDVQNPLAGPDGAPAVYGPQKGATADVAALDARAGAPGRQR